MRIKIERQSYGYWVHSLDRDQGQKIALVLSDRDGGIFIKLYGDVFDRKEISTEPGGEVRFSRDTCTDTIFDISSIIAKIAARVPDES